MRRRIATGSTFAALGFAALTLTGGALPVAALPIEEPVDLGGEAFVDTTGRFTGQADAINQHLTDNNAESDADVYAIVIDSFDEADSGTWANDAAQLSGLDQSSILIVIADSDQLYGTSTAQGFPRDDAQVEAWLNDVLEPELSNGDYPGAITSFSDAVTADDPAPGTGPAISDEAVSQTVGTGAAVLGGVAVLGGGAWLISRGVKRNRIKKGERQAVEQQQLSLEELKKRADIALVRLDDTVQQSDQELQFATAQFGNEPVAKYNEALERAKAGLKEAFGLQQQLDDAFPDSDQERHDWSSRILQIADGATAELGSHAKGFAELRNLEQNAPQAIEAAAAVRGQLDGRIAAATQTLDELDDQYAGSSIEPVKANIDGAKRLLPVIDQAITEGKSAGTGGKAALAVHAAEAAIAQANALLNGVERAKVDLPEARKQLQALVDDTVADIATAKSLPRTQTDLAPIIQLAEQGIQQARQQPLDVNDVLAKLQRANQSLDQATGQVRDAHGRSEQSRRSYDRWMQTARSNIDMAEQYLSTRRYGVGAHARQLLSQAKSDFDQAVALETSDIDQAAQFAESAAERSRQALDDAQNDVDGFGGQSRNPYYRDDRGSRGGDMLTGGLLGYILGDMMSGRGGGYGGGGYDNAGGGGLGGIFGGDGGGGGFSGGGGSFGGFFGGDGGGGFGGFDGGGGSFGD